MSKFHREPHTFVDQVDLKKKKVNMRLNDKPTTDNSLSMLNSILE
ncbi:MAG: hypothetical protein ACQEWV_33535 [Bacillota bacterium]